MHSQQKHSPRRFQPLNSDLRNAQTADTNVHGKSYQLPVLKGIVFDVDGTLCEPQNYMFGQMRTVLNIDKSVDILDHLHSLPEDKQADAMEAIRAIEHDAMIKQTPQAGLVELMEYLELRGLRKGICTRNLDTPVNHLIDNFLNGKIFSPIVTREFRPPKPDPAGILHIAENWGLDDRGNSLIMVGDSVDDMTAGYKAGAATVLLVNEVNAHLARHEHTDLCITRLDELIDILERGFEGQIALDDENPDTRAQAERALPS
ncbi:MAG: 37S ribosomal protein S24, mitochondrial [Chaenotheca gracillima]|nr:MAG: 37S ribosomal protein S24, mitochondrial [Chaenotheca gracillima]